MNKNPIPTMTTSMITLEMRAYKGVLAPVPSRITHLDKPTHDGKPLKNEASTLPMSYAKRSFINANEPISSYSLFINMSKKVLLD